MSCNNQANRAGQLGECLGGVNVHPPQQPLITYKYLRLTPDKRFVSSVAGREWQNLSMTGSAQEEKESGDWVWSCLTPDNPELAPYREETSVLVTLQVWGNIVVGDNGVVQSQHARIIGYDSDDYYLALLYYKPSDLSRIIGVVSNPKKVIIAKKYYYQFTEQEVLKYVGEINDPQATYHLGLQNNLDCCREIACKNPKYAYLYALRIDQRSRDDTRTAACQDPEYAYNYALFVDRKLHKETRLAVCNHPLYAYYYARDVDKEPHYDTRMAACQEPEYAYLYARDVDK